MFSFFDFLTTRLERQSASPFWVFQVVGAASILALMICFPRLDYLLSAFGVSFSAEIVGKYPHLAAPFNWGYWSEFAEKVAAPFENLSADHSSHQSKWAFRLFLPLVARAAMLPPLAIVLLQTLMAIGLLYLLYKIAVTATRDRVGAALFVGACSTLPFVYSGFFNFFCKFDSMAFFFVVLSCFRRNPLSIAIPLFFACWIDERALLSCLLVYAWWGYQTRSGSGSLRMFSSQQIAVCVAVAAYLAIRAWLSMVTDLHTPVSADSGISLSLLARALSLVPLGLWSYFRGAWLLVFIGAWYFVANKELGALRFGIICCVPLLFLPFLVHDVTRSGSYLFVLLLLALQVSANACSIQELRRSLLIVFVFNILAPNVYMTTEFSGDWRLRLGYFAEQSFPIQLVEYLYYY